jgi:Na+-driven multidrug efflux pump
VVLSKHLQAQSQVALPALVVLSTSGVYVALAPHLVAALGLVGAPIALSIAGCYQFVAMALAVTAYEGLQVVLGRLRGTSLTARIHGQALMYRAIYRYPG